MKTMSTNQKFILAGGLILLIAVLTIVLMTYFNTKEIKALIDGCEENGGQYDLNITKPLTSGYEFECKK
ncbi:hypothetical protein [Bhargavaea cecembensis]|uniref:hypothetical protein n=1 Tax=Bhargavaea cecembensis TaxID=394098 RepID=UPI00058F6AC5|nr:hypothetical protein [Bhargavaea cecembensis]